MTIQTISKSSESNQIIRVLHVVGIMNCGGTESMLMTYYRQLDKSKIQFDFLVQSENKGFYDEEIKSLGGKVYSVASVARIFRHRRDLKRFFLNHNEHQIIHIHTGTLSLFVLLSAAKYSSAMIISHAHSRGCNFDSKWLIKQLFRFYMRRHLQITMACSNEAALWHYGKKKAVNTIILKNAIDTSSFQYSESKKNSIRERYGWTGKFVVGHVGRFCAEKNHEKLISVFIEIKKRATNAILVLVGPKDNLYHNILEKVYKYNLQDSIFFMGACDNIPEIMQGFDVFCFPSKHEGFGIALLEAQSAGLLCVASTSIPQSAIAVSEHVKLLSYDVDDSLWAAALLASYERTDTTPEIVRGGFDIIENTSLLYNFYASCVKQNK